MIELLYGWAANIKVPGRPTDQDNRNTSLSDLIFPTTIYRHNNQMSMGRDKASTDYLYPDDVALPFLSRQLITTRLHSMKHRDR